jgi:protein ImuB
MVRPPLVAGVCVPDAAMAGALSALAREFSPRLETHGDRAVLIDVTGLGRLIGTAEEIGVELRRAAAARGLETSAAIAATRMAALLLAHGRPGLTIVPAGREAASLAPLPLGVLHGLESAAASASSIVPHLQTFRRWGVRTLGDLAALPPADLSERIGQEGLRLHRIARGLDPRPIVSAPEPLRFLETTELEWPIEGLEPLSFVLARLLDPLCASLERADAGAAAVALRLRLVARLEDARTRAVHARRLDLPAPMRDPRVLRTLLLLDLEAHPPSAGFDLVEIEAEPAPGRIVQFSLLERARPSPEQTSTLLARLGALMGEGRCGSPALIDSHRPGAFEIRPFDPDAPPGESPAPTSLPPVLRRFRVPPAIRVAVERGRPMQVTLQRRGLTGGRVVQCAGPWRTSGLWWSGGDGDRQPSAIGGSWNRDEWDVALDDGGAYRLYRDRDTDTWFLDAVLD